MKGSCNKMTYSSAVKYIEKDCPPGSKYGLERVEELLGRLGNPEKKMKLIHVAGTNGKGSISRMLQSVLTAAGYRTGIFNSPFLSEPTEYLCVDGKDATKKEYSEIAQLIKSAVEGTQITRNNPMTDRPTEFELSFAMAVKYFEIRQCDYVILECGLGGLTDATNCIPSPVLSVLTNIGLDHTKLLGDTIEKITEQKCGIIKTGCSVVAYPSDKKAIDIIKRHCKEKNCPLYIADFEKTDSHNLEIYGEPALSGEFQKRNLSVVLEAVGVLNETGAKISPDMVKKGIRNVVWPARFEVIIKEPLIILDGGHNEQCVEALCESLDKLKIKNSVFVIGVMADKDYPLMFERLKRYAGYVITTEPANPRRLSADISAKIWKLLGVASEAVPSPSEAVKKAVSISEQMRKKDKSDGNEAAVIVTGSLYMMGEVRKTLLKY